MRWFVTTLFASTLLWSGSVGADAENILNLDKSGEDAPYSRLYLNDSTYTIRDKDYSPQQPEYGLFTTWLYDPDSEDVLQLRARYCVPELSLANSPPAVLEAVDLIDDDRVVVPIRASLGAIPANREVIRPASYSPGSGSASLGFGFGRPSFSPWRSPHYSPFYAPPAYRPALSCASGSAGFDLIPVVGALEKIPEKTLKIRLRFSTGDTSYWQLGAETVRELKRMLALREKLSG